LRKADKRGKKEAIKYRRIYLNFAPVFFNRTGVFNRKWELLLPPRLLLVQNTCI